MGKAEAKTAKEGGAKRAAHKKAQNRKPVDFRQLIGKMGVKSSTQLSKKACAVLESMAMDVARRIADQANKLTAYAEMKTVSCRMVLSAIRSLMEPDLARHVTFEVEKTLGSVGANSASSAKKAPSGAK